MSLPQSTQSWVNGSLVFGSLRSLDPSTLSHIVDSYSDTVLNTLQGPFFPLIIAFFFTKKKYNHFFNKFT